MQEIKFFLEKFKNFVTSDTALKTLIIRAVQNQTGISLDPMAIKINHWRVYLSVRPAVRSEIFLNHEAIMKELEAVLHHQTPKQLI